MDRARVLSKIVSDVEQYGWHVVLFPEEGQLPAYGYTIGLTENFQHPEIALFGLSPDSIHLILNHVGEFIKDGGLVVAEVEYRDEFIDNYPVVFLDVDPAYLPRYFQCAYWYYQTAEHAALQMVWPDTSGRFPWQDGFDTDLKFKQPLLDRNTDFLFYEERNLEVYTTRQVLEEKFPILSVYHDYDGDWQFLCNTTDSVDDLRLVAMEVMTKLDPSLNDLFDVPAGWRAWRMSYGQIWNKEPDEERK